MKPYGIGTVNLVKMNKIVEIPITLPQDHQMLKVLDMSSGQVVKVWIELMDSIWNIGGICSILMHPDYELADKTGLKAYEELLNALIIGDAHGTIPKELITNLT